MNKFFATTLIAIASLGATFSASAQEATLFDTDVVSTQSRAQVRAGVVAALAAGQDLRYGEARSHITGQPVNTGITRAAVRAQVIQALANGQNLGFGEARV